mmetsp:Transcript_86868/g.254243  ORF Transcript_86868/g.254243 Transcript_86868/m.254243 type:complete len:571 (-) Transcript_86868:739-2451(-)
MGLDDLHPRHHDLAGLALDAEAPAGAHVVGPADREVLADQLLLHRVDQLLGVVVPREAEPLHAAHAYADAGLPGVGVLLVGHVLHPVEDASRPGPVDRVGVPEPAAPERGRLVYHLPVDLRGAAPSEGDLVNGARGDPRVPAVHHPEEALAVLVGAEAARALARAGHAGVERPVSVVVHPELEALAARLAQHQAEGPGVLPLLPGLHLVALVELVPAADDPDGLLGSVISINPVPGCECVVPLIEAAVVVIGVKLIAEGVRMVGIVLVVLRVGPRNALAIEVMHRSLIDGALHRDVVNLLPVQLLHCYMWPTLGRGKDVCAGVGATEAEGRDAGVACVVAIVGDLVREDCGVAIDVQVGIQLRQVTVGRPGAGGAHHHALDDASGARACLQVANVRLCAGLDDGHRAVLHDAAKGADLDGVSQGSAGAVALGAGDFVGGAAGLVHGAADALLLCWPVWSRHARTAAVLIQASTDDSREGALRHDFLVSDEERTVTLPPREAVGGVVEGEAAPQGRKHVRPTQIDVVPWARNQVGSTHESLRQRIVNASPVLLNLAIPEHGVPHAVRHQRG